MELLPSTGDLVEVLLRGSPQPAVVRGLTTQGEPITLAETAEVVRRLLGGKSRGVDEIHPEYLNSLDLQRQYRLAVRDSAFGVADWGGGSSF